MNQFSYEIAAASGNDTDACATQSGFRHFGEQSAAAFTNNYGGGLLNHFFEMGVSLGRIFDGKQSCIYKIKMVKTLIYQRRLPSFIYSPHFAHKFFVLPIIKCLHINNIIKICCKTYFNIIAD